MQLKINPELQKHIWPLKPEEFEQLEKNILDRGIKDKLVVWGGTIIDGHNRYKIAQKHGLDFDIEEIQFEDIEEAKDWMDANQAGRRNLTLDQFKISIGRVYNRKKKKQYGRSDRNFSEGHFDPPKPTADKLAKENKVSAKSVKRYGKIADEFEKLIIENPDVADAITSGEKTFKEIKKEERKKEKQDKRKEAVKQFENASRDYRDGDIKIYFEEFQKGCDKIDDNSVDAIITDPPYPIEFIHLWEDMFRVADRILKPSAYLVTYANHQNLDKIFQLPNPLKYYWTFKLDFTAKPIAMGRNLIATWKPVLIYQKMPFKKIEDTIEDVVKETKEFKYDERDYHDLNWGQSLGKFEYMIDKFTNPGDLVVEPFAGTGTTLVACKNTNRKCIGFEIEKDKYEKIIKGRIVEGK